jgi:hypothetical protein
MSFFKDFFFCANFHHFYSLNLTPVLANYMAEGVQCAVEVVRFSSEINSKPSKDALTLNPTGCSFWQAATQNLVCPSSM